MLMLTAVAYLAISIGFLLAAWAVERRIEKHAVSFAGFLLMMLLIMCGGVTAYAALVHFARAVPEIAEGTAQDKAGDDRGIEEH